MQQERRTNPYPWTWEPAAAIGLGVALVGALGVQAGRSLALLATGHGWHWPPGDQLLRSLPGLLTGNASAGLTTVGPAVSVPPAGLASAIVTVEILLALALTLAGKWAWDRWGTGRILGMASRPEAEQTLGLIRLHQVRRIIRPDLYPQHQRPWKATRP